MLIPEDKATRQIKFQRHREQSGVGSGRVGWSSEPKPLKNIHRTLRRATDFPRCSIYADRQQKGQNILLIRAE